MIFLYFLCCFRCDTEQVAQGSHKSHAVLSRTHQNGYHHTWIRVLQRLKATDQLDKDGLPKLGCTDFFSNPQKPFTTIHLSEIAFFQVSPAFLYIYLPAVLFLILRYMEMMEMGQCSYLANVRQKGKGVCPDKCYSVSRNFHLI